MHLEGPQDRRAAIRITYGGLTMKNSNFTVLEKNVMRRSPPLIVPTLVIAAALMLANPSVADVFPFQVVFEDVPGVEEIRAGNIQAGIDILVEQLKRVESDSGGDIWVTLCAAYIINSSLDQAESACTKAVDLAPIYAAYNNRGVLRTHQGDLSGARKDFERVRPLNMEAYMDELKKTDARLVAVGNFDLINQLLAKYTATEINASAVMSTAAIEDLKD